ncbi:MAG: peptide ABC transporter substrate-binding protein [Thermaceae bacterium]|nr:peptide ABC transporter substrate-binding protein [Thermaceae bacterium]
MKRWSKFTVLGLSLVAGAGLAGPSDNSLIIGASQEPTVLGGDFLNVISNQVIKTEIEQYLNAPLTTLNLNSEQIPVLVTEVPSEANKRLRLTDIGNGKRRLQLDYTLKPGLKWSDGNDISTDDVAFVFEVAKAKGMALVNPDFWSRVSLQVKDKQNFTVTFEPAYYYDATVSMAGASPNLIAPSHLMRPEWEKVKAATQNLSPDKDATKLNELYRNFFQQFGSQAFINSGKMVWSGPFKVTRWSANNAIEMVRNPNFTAITPQGGADKYVQKVTFRIIQNTNSLLVAILGGGIDATEATSITGDQARSKQLLSRAPGRYDVWAVANPTWEHIDINKFPIQQVKDLTFDDKRTRQALLYAINREAWVKAFFDGAEPVANSWVANVNPLFTDNVTKYPYNPEKAKQLLAAVGWKPGPDGVLVRNGKRFEFELVTTSGNSVRERTQQLFIEQWKQVGISVKPNNAPSAVVFADNFIQRGSEGKWMTFMFAWTSSLGEDGSLFQYKNTITGTINVPTKENNYAGQNIGDWRNDEFDKLTSQGSIEFDEAKRKQLFAQAQQIWAEDVPALPLRFRSNYYVTKKDLVNYVGSAYSGVNGYPGWNPWEIGWASRGAVKLYDQTKVSGSTNLAK